ncbi:hypothetical protein EVJ50_07265 [Synechococcus sp. RSCCF101]|uniref:YciI family protein n=1 Tax=Synechococcus sp. RSCCF101 TaxID=2511069 RepID=UPI0012453626|nr:YciI family protein [Synechococcus sp. RSCCF101]QEY32062.1 hypothetical protein EVJ50_07265 [Synechococcus sp. RSCCF101]
MARFVVWGRYCEGAIEKRTPFRQEHLDRLKTLKQEGSLITLGPTQDSSHLFAIFEAESREWVDALLRQDVYWRQGIWIELQVYPWIQAF